MKSGIYRIVNLLTGAIYIGSAVNFSDRWRTHLYQLDRDIHHSPYLQRSWNKHGPKAFSFQVLLICDKKDLLFFEQLCIDGFKPKYNTCPVAGSRRGAKLSELERIRIGVQSARRWEEDREKMLIAVRKGHEKLSALWKDEDWAEVVTKNIRIARQKGAQLLTYDGKTQPVSEWAREFGLPHATLLNRLKAGWDEEEALMAPITPFNTDEFERRRRLKKGYCVYEYKGNIYSLTQLAAYFGIKKDVLHAAIKKKGMAEAVRYYEQVLAGNRPRPPKKNIICEYQGESHSTQSLSELFGVTLSAFRGRLVRYGLEDTLKYYEERNGMSDEEAAKKDAELIASRRKDITHNGVTKSRKEWARLLGYSRVSSLVVAIGRYGEQEAIARRLKTMQKEVA